MKTFITTEIFDFAQLEPHARHQVEEMLAICKPHELAHVREVSETLASALGNLSKQIDPEICAHIGEDSNILSISALIAQLAEKGGAIVSTAECCPIEIAAACLEHRFAVDQDNLGFIRRPADWLERIRENAQKPFVTTYRRNAGL